MITDAQRKELLELKSHFEDGLVSCTEAGMKVADIVFPRSTIGETVEAALATKMWRDYDESCRPQVGTLFDKLLK